MMYVKNYRLSTFPRSLTAAFALLLISGSGLAADLYQQAEQQVQAGDIKGMAQTYKSILAQKPGDIRARLGYATAQSWLGKHGEAQAQFRHVLNNEPKNLEALTGLGYSHAWAEQYFDAETQFNRALKVAPDNLGAKKGLAYTYLWSGQSEQARQMLQPLSLQHPDDAELLAALGQAQRAQGMDKAAEESFRLALQAEPGRQDALDGLAAIEQERSSATPSDSVAHPIELSASFGDTSDGGDSGLREVFVGYQPNTRSRVWFRYDDSLSLDNPALARSGQDAETIYLGFQNLVNPLWLVVGEIGSRDLPNGADQQIYKVEGVHFPTGGKTVKLGAQLSPHSDDYTDKLLYAGYGFPYNDQWRLEPTLYLSSSGAIDDKEWRAVLFGEYQSESRWSAGLGAGFGQISSDLAAADGSVSTANARLTYPINAKTKVNLSLRYEDTPTNSYSTTLIGIAVQLP